jgi:putative YhbY family RNA-binding protein
MPAPTSPKKRALMPSTPLRRRLRAAGHHLSPVVQVGKEGVTEAVVRQLDEALAAHELVKVKIGTESPEDRFEAAERLGAEARAQIAQVLGRTVLVYRRHPEKPRFEPLEKPRGYLFLGQMSKLVVAGEARRGSRATIRPTRSSHSPAGREKPSIRVKGRRILYVVTLRPLWFLDSTPEERIATILHELYHASIRFDGSLHRGRRHSRMPRAAYNRRIRRLLARYLATAPAECVAPFAHDGLVRARMWLERPASFRAGERRGRRTYTERQLFYGLARMRTPRRASAQG